MKRVIRATKNPAVTERETRNALLARKIGAEGIVLLENDGALPLKNQNIALYGLGARHTAFGGTGSGENRPRYRVNIEDGLMSAGFSIANGAWLDALDAAYVTARKVWRKQLIKGLKKCKKTAQMDYASAHPFLPPLGGEIKREADTALYVLTRQAGEGSDRRTEAGDYYIRPEEFEQLKTLSSLYPQTILILNVSGVIDLSFTKELSLSAVVLVLQGGMEAGNSVADVLSGKVCPSGRLAATWAEKYEDYPSHDTYSYRNGNPREEDYFEALYVGYRWFHANNLRARYPFGYGLSYTNFEQACKEISVKQGKVTCRVEVKNTGECAGREVVQLYLSAPDGKLQKEKVSLAGFVKTRLLQPGEREEREVVFELCDFASYDIERAAFVLERGDYVLYLGNNAEALSAVGVLSLDREVLTEQCKNVCPVQSEITFFTPAPYEREAPALARVAICADEIQTVTHSYQKPTAPKKERVDLSLGEKIKLLVGTSYVGAVRNTVFGAAGYTTSAFYKRGIENMPMTDGPQGLNVKPVSKKPGQNFFNIPAIPEAMRYGILGLLAGRERKKGTYYQYATAFPSEALCAQTWDTALIREEGRAVGEEMEELGVVYFLAPAMNIQRNPLCGRNYEYYSEDPLITGKIAAALTLGVQEHAGRYATLKHFACNNLETERNVSSSNLDERTLREIYLKAFKIAVREAQPRSVMASYNLINGRYVCNSYELLTDVLRNEFGFDGVVMTDWLAAGHDESRVEKCAGAGCDLVMPGLPGEAKKIERAFQKGEITKEEIEISAARILRAALKEY